MDKRKFIKQELRSKIIFIAVFAIFNLLWGLLGSLRISFYSSGAIFIYSNTNTLYTSFFPFLFASIYPLTIFSYRYSKPSVDFFYQMPVDKRYIKRVRMIIGLLAIFLIFTLNFLLDTMIVAIRYGNTPLPPSSEVYYRKVEYNFLGYLLSYPLLLVAFFVAFGVSSFFASLSNNKKDMILLVFFGLAILFTAFLSFWAIITGFAGEELPVVCNLGNPLEFSFAPVSSLFNAIRWSENVVLGIDSSDSTGVLALRIVSYSFSIICGIFGFFYAYFAKERSGEAASSNGGYDAFTVYLPHLCFFFLGILAASRWAYRYSFTSYFIGSIILSLAYLLSYYFLVAFYYKRLKIAKRDLYAYFAVAACFIVLSLSLLIFSLRQSSFLS